MISFISIILIIISIAVVVKMDVIQDLGSLYSFLERVTGESWQVNVLLYIQLSHRDYFS